MYLPNQRFIDSNSAYNILYPLIGILHLFWLNYSALSLNKEIGIVMAGFIDQLC